MGVDTPWRDDIEVPAGQPADLETLTKIINNLSALKEEQPLVEGMLVWNSTNKYNNLKSLVQIEAGFKWHGRIPLSKAGRSGDYRVNFVKPFAKAPIVVATSQTKGIAIGACNISSVNASSFLVSYTGHTTNLNRGVSYIAIGLKG